MGFFHNFKNVGKEYFSLKSLKQYDICQVPILPYDLEGSSVGQSKDFQGQSPSCKGID